MRNTILRRLSLANKSSLLRSLGLSTAACGSGLYFYSDIDTDSRRSLWRTWGEMIVRPSFNSSSWPFQYGNVPLFFSSPEGDIPPVDSSNEGTRCCNGCFGKDSIANAAAMVGPAVVKLSATLEAHGVAISEKIGSGTIINSDGTILTCGHFLSTNQCLSSEVGKIYVMLQDGRTFGGKVLNVDNHSDIAIIKIESETPLPYAKLGSSSKLRPGDWVLAMGCPLSLQNSVTAGIVSFVDRKNIDLGVGGMRMEYIQADCATNDGNSGGPFVNIDGEVIGVNTLKLKSADGLNFAVPIDSVLKIIQQFKKRGMVVQPWLELKMVDLDGLIIAQLKEIDPSFPNVTKGVLIPMVTPGSPADRGGMIPGDVIVEFGGKAVGTAKEIIDLMTDQIGMPIKVAVMRCGDENITNLTVVPEEANPNV